VEYARLGATGLSVSRLCLGTATFGGQADEARSRAILDRAAAAGVSFFDTADVYPMDGVTGESEEILGRWLNGRRDQFVLATKGGLPTGSSPLERGNSRRHLVLALERSLRRLKTDWVDVYLLHGPDPDTPIEESLEALDDLVSAGKVRYAGCSNFPALQVARALGRSDARGLARFAELQPRYNLLHRECESELVPLALEEGLGIVPYNPLAGGLLTGKHGAAPVPGSRFGLQTAVGRIYRERYWSDAALAVVKQLRRLADEAGVAPVTLAVAWLLSRPAVTSVILGATRAEQLDATLAALEVPLDAASAGALNQTSDCL
jgi:aryl-alcohol dehydrogenase-like predicted oxidoreductase